MVTRKTKKIIKRKKPVRREIKMIPLYGNPTHIGRYKDSDISVGERNELYRNTDLLGYLAPDTVDIGINRYYFFKRFATRSKVKSITNQLRKQGYKTKNFQVKRHIGSKAIVVDNILYTNPKHPKADKI